MWRNVILDRYKTEPALINLLTEIDTKKAEFEKSISGITSRGNPYGFAGMRPEVSIRLYGLVREFKPKTLIETGVCNGVSTAVILAALERNDGGRFSQLTFRSIRIQITRRGLSGKERRGLSFPRGIRRGG
jgi:predicted O-methyltransferase YrrM